MQTNRGNSECQEKFAICFFATKPCFQKKVMTDTGMLLHNSKETEGKRLGSGASAHTKFLLKTINREAKLLEKKKGPGSTIEAAGSAHSPTLCLRKAGQSLSWKS